MPIELKKREVNTINKSKYEDLKKAMKTDETGKPVKLHWKWDEAKEFIDFIVDESAGLLSSFRIISMDWPTKEIAKVLDTGKFLKPGWSYKRTNGVLWAAWYEFEFDSIKLVSEKVEWLVYLPDDEIDDNIEGTKWEEHVKRMVAKKIANEWIEVVFYGRKLSNPSGANGILNVFDGIKYLTEQFGNVENAEWAEITRRIIIKAKKILKTKYRKEVSVFMDSDIKTDFDELYNDPNGNRGNGEIIKNSVSWMNLNEVPLMSSEQPIIDKTITTTVNGSVAAWDKTINVNSDLTAGIQSWDSIVVNEWLAEQMTYTVNTISPTQITTIEPIVYWLESTNTIHKATLDWADTFVMNPKNICIGVQKDIIVEFERVAPDGFNIWYKMKKDIKIENPEAVVMVTNLKSKEL